MASKLVKLQIPSTRTTNLSTPSPRPGSISQFLPPHQTLLYSTSSVSFSPRPKTLMSVHCSLSSTTPPRTREEAINQAKTCLSVTLAKPLNNIKLEGKVKKLTQARFQVEIPLAAETPDSLSRLAVGVFKDLTVARKGAPVNIYILWPSSTLKDTAVKAFRSLSSPCNVVHVDVSSVSNGDNRILGSADVVVFLAPEASQVPDIKSISESVFPKPVVILNPRWLSEEETETDFGELNGFVRSFEVIYTFAGLMVERVEGNLKGAIFKCVRDGVVRGEKWNILVEEEGKMKVVSSFKARPSIADIEGVLYNVINSPITKSVRFFTNWFSNITGKKP